MFKNTPQTNQVNQKRRVLSIALKALTLFAVLLMISSLAFTGSENEFAGFHHGKTAAAATLDPKDYITDVELKDLSNPNQDKFGLYDGLEAEWKFTIPDEADLKAGDTLTINIPEQLAALTDADFNVVSEAGNVFASVHVSKGDKTIKVTFNSYTEQAIKDHTVHGTLKLDLTFDSSTISVHKKNHIDWGFGNKATDVNVLPDEGPKPNEIVFKWSWFDPKNPNLIHWQIRVNAARTHIEDAVVTDDFGPGMELVPDSVKAGVAIYNPTNNTYLPGDAVPAEDIHVGPGNHYRVDLHNINETYIVQGDSLITDGRAQKAYANSAKVQGDNIDDHSITVYQGLTSGSGSADADKKKKPNKPVNPTPPAPNPAPNPTPNPTPGPKPEPAKPAHHDETPVKPEPKHELPVVPAPNNSQHFSVGDNIRLAPAKLPNTAKRASWRVSAVLTSAAMVSLALAMAMNKKKH